MVYPLQQQQQNSLGARGVYPHRSSSKLLSIGVYPQRSSSSPVEFHSIPPPTYQLGIAMDSFRKTYAAQESDRQHRKLKQTTMWNGYIHIYIYIERERERQRSTLFERPPSLLSPSPKRRSSRSSDGIVGSDAAKGPKLCYGLSVL